MKNTTLLFLVKKEGESVVDICLAMKKRGFGAGRYNGVGGKVESNESIRDAVVREAKEEIGVDVLPSSLQKVAELTFVFPHNSSFNQVVHTFITTQWQGELSESEEMRGEWFKVIDIPYTSMWPDDIFWLPRILEGKKVKAQFTFGEGDVILDQEVTLKEVLL